MLIANIIGASLLFAPAISQGDEDFTQSDESNFENASPPPSKLTIYKHIQSNGVVSFSDKEPIGHAYEIVRVDCYACNIHSKVNWGATRLFLTEYSETIDSAARTNGVDPALVRALIHAESHFNPAARSNKGAVGLMQLMPATAKDMGVRNPNVAEQNIQGGVKYLAFLLKKFKGNVTLATAAYNAGPGTVSKYNGIPPYAETQAYVERVKILHKRYQAST